MSKTNPERLRHSPHLDRTVAPLIARHRGRVVKLLGDGVLASSNSAAEAVSCAVERQQNSSGRIVTILPGRVQHSVVDRSARKPADEKKAYWRMLRGKALRDGLNARDTAKARALLERAVALDPLIARSYMNLADTYVIDLWLGLGKADAPEHALHIARKELHWTTGTSTFRTNLVLPIYLQVFGTKRKRRSKKPSQ